MKNKTNGRNFRLREADLARVSGGKVAYSYFTMAKRIQQKELREHRRAFCPNCGERFIPIWSLGDLSSIEIACSKQGDNGFIYCRSCRKASDSQEWFESENE